MTIKSSIRDYLHRLRSNLTKEGVPYGYTLTIWCAGALGIDRYGHPHVAGVLLFAAGGILAYSVLALALQRCQEGAVSTCEKGSLSFIDLVSVPSAILVALLVYSQVDLALIGFPLSSFAATLVYNLLLATESSLFGGHTTQD